MYSKRKCNFDDDYADYVQGITVDTKKHSLDSDEDDSDDCENILCLSEVEGEEDGVSKIRDAAKITPFNIKEELEEGHFDKEGHYHWNKSDDIKDNWLDNIDWIKIERENEKSASIDNIAAKPMDVCNESLLYNQLLSYMIEGETVAGSIHRLNKNRAKLSSLELLRLRKSGVVDDDGHTITKITELANEILTKTGYMDIYLETYESIKTKVNNMPSTSKNNYTVSKPNFDIYSGNFYQEEELLKKRNSAKIEASSKELLWEFKWKDSDSKLQGPFTTQQMLKWSTSGYFKSGVYVRKMGEQTNFCRSNRIDFDLYL